MNLPPIKLKRSKEKPCSNPESLSRREGTEKQETNVF